MTQMEKQFIAYIENQAYDEAKALLETNDSLIDAPGSAEVASAVALYLLMNQDYDSCITYARHYLKTFPSADLYFNTAYAYECLGNSLMAIEHYQCARLYTLDTDLRSEAHLRIQSLRYGHLSEADFECLLQYKAEERNYIIAQLESPSTLVDPNLYIKTKMPHIERQVFILFGTMEIANHIAHYLNYFRGQGFDVFGINYVPSYLEYDCDFSFSLETLSGEAAFNHYTQNAADLIGDYDVFHFLFNKTLMPNAADIIPLKVLKKAVFMHGLGSEIRTPSIARVHHPYWAYAEDYLGQLNEEGIKSNLRTFSNWIDNCIVNDHEMLSYVKPYYKKTYMVGLPIDLNKYPFVGISNKQPIKIVHAPTNQSVKGSKFFERAIEILKEQHMIDYRRIERTSHEEAMKLYAQADIILDELIIGTYGSLTIECMAMGKCVCTFINSDFETPHGEEIPVWSVNPENIVERLDQLLSSESLRNELSLKGRQYVERNNDMNQIGKRLLEIYIDGLKNLTQDVNDVKTASSLSLSNNKGIDSSSSPIDKLYSLDSISCNKELELSLRTLLKPGSYEQALLEINQLLRTDLTNPLYYVLLMEHCHHNTNSAGVFHYGNQISKYVPSALSILKEVYAEHLSKIDTTAYINYQNFAEVFEDDLRYAYNNNLISEKALYNLISRILPSALIAEIYRGCNLKCPLCPLQGHTSVSKDLAQISPKVIDRIYEDEVLMNHLDSLYLHNLGESLLNPNLLSYVRRFKDKYPNVKLKLDTNLSLRINAQELVLSGLDEITVALDGYDQASYSHYRVNGKFDLVLENIKQIVRIKKELDRSTPVINLKAIAFKHLEPHLNKIRELASLLETDNFGIQKPIVFNPENPKYIPVDHKNWICTDSKYSRYIPVSQTEGRLINKKKQSKGCTGILTYLAPSINYDGSVFPCCFIATEETVSFGNLNDLAFSEIWLSKSYVDFRYSVFQNRSANIACRFCDSE